MTKILILQTNHATLGATDEPNGTYAPELTHALQVFMDAGFDYDIASIQGGAVPIYGADIEDGVNERVLPDSQLQTRLGNSLALAQINIADYDAVFYPGGFGLLSDLAENTELAKLTAAAWESVLSATALPVYYQSPYLMAASY